ncbi:MAG: hypothetical protein KJO05_02220 [Bacteroidia bacterium]|nr:hypothetical protein [Bacteroidia bacterium]NNK55624.1 hypothetical protein [Flavobacteriaceae bacterium]
MKFILVPILVFLLLNCGTPPQKSTTVIINSDTTTVVPNTNKEIIIEPAIPEDAVTANYMAGIPAFYGYVNNVNTVDASTLIKFENDYAPSLEIEESYGAEIMSLRFPEFDSDLLLVTSVIKDPNFNKYYLYLLKNNEWVQVVNGWAIHKENKPDTLQPISVDPTNPSRMHRYYSVFDLDKESELGYTWRLLSERISIQNR